MILPEHTLVSSDQVHNRVAVIVGDKIVPDLSDERMELGDCGRGPAIFIATGKERE